MTRLRKSGRLVQYRLLSALCGDPSHVLGASPEDKIACLVSEGANVNLAVTPGYLWGSWSNQISRAVLTEVLSKRCTPLQIAALTNHPEWIDALVAAGADVNRTTRGQYPALAIACKADAGRCAMALVLAGADVGGDAIMLVREASLLKAMLDRGADPNARNENGFPLLHHFAGYDEALEALLDAGADIDMEDPRGYRLVDVVAELPTVIRNREKILGLVMGRGADLATPSGPPDSREAPIERLLRQPHYEALARAWKAQHVARQVLVETHVLAAGTP